jgi:hypothetical protein
MVKFIKNLFNGRKQQCNIPDVIRWFGFTGHKWIYNKTVRTCKKCGEKQRLLDYEAFYTIWGKL